MQNNMTAICKVFQGIRHVHTCSKGHGMNMRIPLCRLTTVPTKNIKVVQTLRVHSKTCVTHINRKYKPDVHKDCGIALPIV